MMRALAIILLLLFPPTFAAHALADEAPATMQDSERAAIRGVIEGQIGAFRHDDDEAAFSFASPNIQNQFGDAAHFMAMVRQGYPSVYRPRAVAFGELVTIDGRIVQKVELVGPDGGRSTALYFMEQEPNNTWRIDGCVVVEGESVGT